MSTDDDHAHGSATHGPHPAKAPYYKRVHHDWRFWVGLVLAMGCMIYYVMSMDLAWRPSVQPAPSPAVGK